MHDQAMASPSPALSPRRLTLLVLPLYPALAVAGAVTHRPAFALAALMLLVTAALLPRLCRGAVRAWLGWVLLLALVCGAGWAGQAERLLATVPVLILAILAGWFGHTLRRGHEPRVARFIRVLEGADRLAQPGVARYARGVTRFWAGLLALQALLLAALLAAPALTGVALPRWVAAYQHVGGYLLIPLAFGAEYAYRRWHLRHLDHPGLHAQALQMLRLWPQLLHDTVPHR